MSNLKSYLSWVTLTCEALIFDSLQLWEPNQTHWELHPPFFGLGAKRIHWGHARHAPDGKGHSFSEIMTHSETALSSADSSSRPFGHVQETELNYKCDCGNHKSCQHSSFLSLPRSVTPHAAQMKRTNILITRFLRIFFCSRPIYRVLMLQLKRFFYTPFLTVRKLQSSIQVFEQLLLTSSQVTAQIQHWHADVCVLWLNVVLLRHVAGTHW